MVDARELNEIVARESAFIDRIQDRDGKTVWRHDARACGNCQQETWQGQAEPELEDTRLQIIDPHTAYQMTSILEGVTVRGTASTLRSSRRFRRCAWLRTWPWATTTSTPRRATPPAPG